MHRTRPHELVPRSFVKAATGSDGSVDNALVMTTSHDGLLSGRYRILEYRRRGSLVKAYLQRPNGSEWQNVAARYYRCRLFTWWRTDVRALQNLPA